MPELRFQVEDIVATPNSAVPQLSFKVRIANSEPGAVHSIALRAQIQIEPVRRRYTPAEQERLNELFGEPERWSKSLHPLLWTNENVNIPGFTGTTVIDIQVQCTFDFNVAITKYIYGLEDGEIPMTLLFSGTVFYPGPMGLQIAQIPWDRDATCRLPIRVWKEMMDLHYPGTAWICVRREVFERINEYRARHGISNWDQAFERMLSLTAGVR
ncbi:MAG: hypothetical protein JWN74_685 [Acidobacteriaceae bacterium]|nr:hypothetical protein [Acidobacteriaceae bacterium]